MSGSQTIRRGDVILAPIPFIQNPRQSKTRPVVVIQTDDTNEPRDQLIVALIPSQIYFSADSLFYSGTKFRRQCRRIIG